ncbi:kinase-like domain-containing protein [Choanephora cucurbitarum]|nr:kinase-like domain-containing protein [Choanephora cucurbitarum]
MVGKYYLCKTLGKGSMGKVKLAVDSETGEKVAVKIVSCKGKPSHHKNPKSSEKSREIRTIREASIMLLLNHPNIAQMYEMRQINDNYYLFMEYVDGGQLLDYIISHGKLKEKQARQISRQIASALDYCHRNSIVHRDLKVENILLSATGNIKIIDFGLSNVFTAKSQLSTFCGSLYFAAPELLEGRLYTGPEVDVWSFGVVIYVLVCGIVPFDDPTISGMHQKVKQGVVGYPSYLSAECRHLLKRMILTAPSKRATMSEIIAHPWMNKGYDTPVDNHLPKRKPLTLPVDNDIIKQMSGFEFGSDFMIKAELEGLIGSEEYQRDANLLEAMAYHPIIRSNSRSSKLSSPRLNQNIIQYDPLSMPAAYHPLISVYYLVKERIQQNLELEQETIVTQIAMTSLNKDQLDSFRRRRRRSSHSLQSPSTEAKRKTLLSSLERVSALHPSNTISSSTPTTQSFNLLRRLSRRHHHHQQTMTEDHSSDEDQHKSGHNKFNRFLKRATSVTTKDLPSIQQAKLLSTVSPASPEPPICGAPEYMRRNSAIPESMQSDYIKQRRREAVQQKERQGQSIPTQGHHADENIRSVYIKGLFSVSTTSTKKASVIRSELIQVLSNETRLQFRETHDRFKCWTHHEVVFDIYIVKIPWLLGMRGIQFRRISGDPWQYKTMCSQILELLQL